MTDSTNQDAASLLDSLDAEFEVIRRNAERYLTLREHWLRIDSGTVVHRAAGLDAWCDARLEEKKAREVAEALIGTRIRECRDARQWTISEAAEALSQLSSEPVTVQRWVSWEKTGRVSGQNTAERLAFMFGVNRDHFKLPPC